MKLIKCVAGLCLLLAALTACTGSSVFSLEVGSCFNDSNDTTVSRVETLDCSEPHDNEVYALFDVTGEDFPGDEALQSDAISGCLDRFGPYVGTDFEASSLDLSFLTPSDQSWDDGDREVVCFAYDMDFAKLTGSVKDSGL